MPHVPGEVEAQAPKAGMALRVWRRPLGTATATVASRYRPCSRLARGQWRTQGSQLDANTWRRKSGPPRGPCGPPGTSDRVRPGACDGHGTDCTHTRVGRWLGLRHRTSHWLGRQMIDSLDHHVVRPDCLGLIQQEPPVSAPHGRRDPALPLLPPSAYSEPTAASKHRHTRMIQ
jgi:hypothetical protein